MRGGETNEPILGSNISKGHGHQNSPSHPPLGRGDGVRVTTHANETHSNCTFETHTDTHWSHTHTLKWQSHS
jgi:hypothetical protein